MKFLTKKTDILIAVVMSVIFIFSSVVYVFASEDKTTEYSFSELNLKVSVSNDLVCFTQNVKSSNSNLELIGADDVEQMRAKMQMNNIYLEAVPKDVVNYEIVITGVKAGNSIKDFDKTDEKELNDEFNKYIEMSNSTDNEKVTENVLDSSLEEINGIRYFRVDVKSVNSEKTTVYLRKYYTVVDGKIITFTMQTNQDEMTDYMKSQLQDVVNSAEYTNIKSSIMENVFVSEILNHILMLLIPIAILGLLLFMMTRKPKHKF